MAARPLTGIELVQAMDRIARYADTQLGRFDAIECTPVEREIALRQLDGWLTRLSRVNAMLTPMHQHGG